MSGWTIVSCPRCADPMRGHCVTTGCRWYTCTRCQIVWDLVGEARPCSLVDCVQTDALGAHPRHYRQSKADAAA